MKKLRLIKPWNLQAVRQRLGDSRLQGTEAQLQSCSLPPDAGPAFFYDEAHTDGRSFNRNRPPLSTVVLVSNFRN